MVFLIFVKNLVLLIFAYIYVLAVIGAGIFLQKKLNKSSEFTRKTIHVLAGFVVFVVFFFDPIYAWFADIIAGSFVVLLWMAGPTGPEFMKAMFESMARTEDEEEGKIYGPFYYAISITIVTVIFTFPPGLLVPFYWIPASALSIMYLGDGIAPFIGKRFGKRTYGANKRTYVGSLAVFLLGTIGVVFTTFFAYIMTVVGLAVQIIQFNTITIIVGIRRDLIT